MSLLLAIKLEGMAEGSRQKLVRFFEGIANVERKIEMLKQVMS